MEHASRHIPNALKKYRMMQGMKQYEVAKRIGITADRISHWENGTAMPSVRNLFKLSVLYATLVDQFYPDLMQAIKHQLKE